MSNTPKEWSKNIQIIWLKPAVYHRNLTMRIKMQIFKQNYHYQYPQMNIMSTAVIV